MFGYGLMFKLSRHISLQQSCYEDYYGGTSSAAGSGRGHECGLHLSEDTFRRVEEEEEDPWRGKQIPVLFVLK